MYLGTMYENGIGTQSNLAEAIRWYRKAADQGMPEAQGILGMMYAKGTGVPQDLATAVQLFRKAAEQGLPQAQSVLGNLYSAGAGVPQDHVEAVRWYRMAAERGEVEAQFRLGVRYGLGQGVPKDHVEANRWYRKAAEQGHQESQYLLGTNYFEGRGVGKDLKEAAKWIHKAAEQGDAEAQTRLGNMHRYGQGVPENSVEAVRWYRKAADQGDAKGQFYLGLMYEGGSGVSQNFAEAFRWYGKAAEHGETRAQTALGRAYSLGQGVKKDVIAAYAWSTLGASQSDDASSQDEEREYAFFRDVARGLRDHLARELTPQQLSQAQVLARKLSLKGKGDERAVSPSATPTEQKSFPKQERGEPPVIVLQPIPATTAQTAEVRGKVTSKGRVTGLQIDGTEVSIGRDGTFSVRRGIPLGESEIKVVATDEWGRSSESRVAVSRTVASTETAYPPLRPNFIHGKPRPDAAVLIIGVEEYKSVPSADFAENDAKAFYDFAINALGVPASRVKLLTGQNAQKVDVDAAILTWLKPLVSAGKTDVFVYFSGHGLASDDGKELFLLPQDGNRALLDRSAIRRSELIDMVASAGVRSATFFIDACYSGGTRGTESLVAAARPVLLAAKEQPVPSNVTILTASANDQLSSALGPARHGLFSYFLMRGLSGEAAGGDRTVTASELAAYLAERVPPEAARLGRSQTPQLVGDGSKVIATW